MYTNYNKLNEYRESVNNNIRKYNILGKTLRVIMEWEQKIQNNLKS